jgi:hypothetical protein
MYFIFSEALGKLNCITPKRRSNGYEIAKAFKGVVVTQFEALSRHLYGGTEKILQIPQ